MKADNSDAGKEGNCMRYSNNQCKDFNAVLTCVEYFSKGALFVQSNKMKAMSSNRLTWLKSVC